MSGSKLTARVEVWIWVLIYAGMALVGLGLATQRGDAVLGWVMVGVGAALIVVGALLIWLRSRMKPG